jgi:hypothetical protein
VSKQWQRLIFNDQKIIIINESYRGISDAIEFKLNFWDKNKISIIKCLTKKFKTINKFEINLEINDEVLKIITENCDNLRKVQFFGHISESFCGKFGENCGHKLEFIDIFGIGISETVTLIKSIPNLKAIEIYDNSEAINKQYLEKLVEIKLNDFSEEWFEKFANLYYKQIKKIKFNEWSVEKNKAIVHLPLFEILESLSFRIPKNSYFNWNQIKSLAKSLKNLKRLTINAYKVNFSFDCLTVFNKLEDFGLIFQEFEDQDMKFIVRLELTKLHLNSCPFLREESLLKLSLMENLSELRIFSGFMTDSGICHLIKNSPKLKTIELNDKHINETTIEAFIEKALNNPKIYYKFMSQFINRKIFISNKIPKNLLIKM